MLSVTEIRSLSELDSLADDWSRLWVESAEPTVAQTLDWYRAYCRTSPSFIEPRIIVAKAAGDVLGILPLVLKRGSFRDGSPRILGLPDEPGLGLCGVVGKNRSATLGSAMTYLRHRRADWDVIEITERTLDGLSGNRVHTAMRFAGWRPATQAVGSLGRFEIVARWPDFLAETDATTRLSLYRSQHNVGHDNRYEFVRHRSGPTCPGSADDIETLLEEAFHISGGPRVSQTRRDFLKEITQSLSADGRADICLLYRDSLPVASMINAVVGDRVVSIYGAVTDHDRTTVASKLVQELLVDGGRRGDRDVTWSESDDHPLDGWALERLPLSQRVCFAKYSTKAQFLRIGRAASQLWHRNETPTRPAPELRVVGT
ncbi:GNAT family N-acetyltransferase [Stratiformator vulcanicus]|uniref:BioF2-like acetyltransferase domain-containing protein n=1 Tax=Stratiformator vulcanicus TaxID=2527980 RepID=A0A517R1V9_9PLAN|nr:GNAT family N-acetyltransferase [Stratiformator vulcanicus]QDT37852.1 hypothetical protein Pan189_22340 [Stratiformator vulcanicus]